MKSIGHEETFPIDLHDHAALDHELVGLADGVASRLRAARRSPAAPCSSRCASATSAPSPGRARCAEPTDLAADIAPVAGELLHALDVAPGVRLLGVSVQQLGAARRDRGDQGTLFGEPAEPGPSRRPAAAEPRTAPERRTIGRQAALERSVDAVRARFGPGAVRARLRRVACQGKVRGARRVEGTEDRAREWTGTHDGRRRTRSPGTEMGAMPLSEDEQRILREIEENLSATDPKLVQQVSDTTLYRHSARVIKWAVVGFVAGLLLMIFTFTTTLILGVVGFLVMLGCALAIEHNVRKLGRAGMESLTGSMRSGALKNMLGNAGSRWRERFGRDDPPS